MIGEKSITAASIRVRIPVIREKSITLASIKVQAGKEQQQAWKLEFLFSPFLSLPATDPLLPECLGASVMEL